MNSKLLDKILHCQEIQIPADMALGIVSLYLCGKKSSNEELRDYCDNWQEENGDATYDKIITYVQELGYIREITEIAFDSDSQ